MLKAVSPIDGRYSNKTEKLQDYFSEYALIKYRVRVEVQYLLALIDLGLPQLAALADKKSEIQKIYDNFDIDNAQFIKETEKTTKTQWQAPKLLLEFAWNLALLYAVHCPTHV